MDLNQSGLDLTDLGLSDSDPGDLQLLGIDLNDLRQLILDTNDQKLTQATSFPERRDFERPTDGLKPASLMPRNSSQPNAGATRLLSPRIDRAELLLIAGASQEIVQMKLGEVAVCSVTAKEQGNSISA
jgi:hypothetical protein